MCKRIYKICQIITKSFIIITYSNLIHCVSSIKFNHLFAFKANSSVPKMN